MTTPNKRKPGMARKTVNPAPVVHTAGYAVVVDGPAISSPPPRPNAPTPPRSANSGQIPVLYDETFRGKHDDGFCIDSMATYAGLLAHLPYHSPDTDGSFSVVVAGGQGVFVKQALYESIPEEHRPPLNTNDAKDIPYDFIGTSTLHCIGSTIFPFTLKDDAGKSFTIKLYALVLRNLMHGAFISNQEEWIESERFGQNPRYFLEFMGREVVVPGNPRRT